MIEFNCEQGSLEWWDARLGIPTASEFSRIITPKGALSKSREEYIDELLAEWCTGEPASDFDGTAMMERGKLMESHAYRLYRFLRDGEPRTAGVCYRDESRMVGCSPDGLVDDDGGIEIKAPTLANHIRYWRMAPRREIPRQYRLQVQGCLWVTGRAWWDFMSYYPEKPPVVVRVLPDDAVQGAFDKHMPAFVDEVLAARSALENDGGWVEGRGDE